MSKLSLSVNGQRKEIDIEPKMPLLWAIRDFIGLTGTSLDVVSANVEHVLFIWMGLL